MSREDIEKLDKQIELLKKDKNNKATGEVETVVTEIHDPEDENHVINISYINSEVKEETKELKDLKSLTTEVEESSEDTKQIIITDTNNNEIKEEVILPIDDNNDNTNNKNNKNNKKLFIILGIVIGLLVLLLIILLFVFSGNDKDNKKSTDNNKDTVEINKLSDSEMIKMVDLYGKTLESEIINYFNQNNKLPDFSSVNNLVNLEHEVVCHIHEIYEDKTIYLDECMVDYVDIKHSYGVKQEIKKEVVDNNNVKVYVHKKTKKATLDEPSDKDNYILYSSNIDSNIYNLTLIENTSCLVYFDDSVNNQTGVIYNYVLGKRALPKVEYKYAIALRAFNYHDYLPYAAVFFDDSKVRIYDLVTGNPIGEEYEVINQIELTKDKLVVGKNNKYGLVNYVTGNLLIPIEYDSITMSGSSVIALQGLNAFIFDSDGNQYLTDISKIGFQSNAINDKYVLNGRKLYNINGKKICDFEFDGVFSLQYNMLDNEILRYIIKTGDEYKCFKYDIGKKECSVVAQNECN